MAKIGIIGSGNVGANTAFFVAEKGITDIYLYDMQEGLSTGKALDMMEAAPIRKYRNRITGVDDLGMMAGAEAVVIAAGAGCSAGSDPEDLMEANWPAVSGIIERIAGIVPECVIIVATEPVDPLVTMISRRFSVPRKRLLGLGGILDAARLKAAISRELSLSAENVTAMVLGRHSRDMVVPMQYARVSGIPLAMLMTEDRIRQLEREASESGSIMAALAECPGTYYTPSAAAADVIDALCMDMKRILPVSTVMAGEYGISGVALSLPCVIGGGGVERALSPELTGPQEKALKKSAKDLEQFLAGVKS